MVRGSSQRSVRHVVKSSSVWVCCLVFLGTALPAEVIYVDARATGSNDGTSWGNAFAELQSALLAAVPGDEVRVAQGVYTPDRGGAGSGGRWASFAPPGGVVIRGGYAGTGATDPDARDVEAYETILSGDLAGDDEPGFGHIEENSYHVVTAREPSDSAVLDGCTISGGNANGEHAATNHAGGGMLIDGVDVTLILCTFRGNSGGSAGGLFVLHGRPILRDCQFVGNRAGSIARTTGTGGGIVITGGEPLLVGCRLRYNSAGAHGGGIGISGANPTLVNCSVEGNSSYFGGGGVSIGLDCQPLLVNCLLRGNTCNEGGAAIYNNESDPVLINCSIVANKAVDRGGGIKTYVRGRPTLLNCIVWGNIDARGSEEVAQLDTYSSGSYVLRHTCVQGWTGRLGDASNHGHDPLFVNASRWDVRGTPQDPSDDVWVEGDDRLLSGSPCVDAGDNRAVPPDVADLDGDGNTTEPIAHDFLGRDRFRDDPRVPDDGEGEPPVVDLGAHEGPDAGILVARRTVRVPEGDVETFTVSLSTDPGGTVEVSVNVLHGDPDISLISAPALVFDSADYFLPRQVYLSAAEDSDNLNGTATIRLRAVDLPTVDMTAREDDDDPVSSILHVDARSRGRSTGASWEDAYPDLQVALSVIQDHPGEREVRVAQGVYRPAGPGGNRSASILLAPGLVVRGGYAGVESEDPGLRDVRAYETILSGDLNEDDGAGPDAWGDNCYHVVKAVGTDRVTTLEGFTITGGRAYGDIADNERGGGLFVGPGSELSVVRCTFVANSAADRGGAMYSAAENLRLLHCSVEGNEARLGGGLHAKASNVLGCRFYDNTASGGGAVFGVASRISMNACSIAWNRATGGAYYGAGGIGGDDDTEIELANCIVWGNRNPSGMDLSAQIDDDVLLPPDVIRYSCIQNWDGDLGGFGNIADDPRFVDPSRGDLHLRPGSPCIDAGTDAELPDLRLDLDGRERPCGAAMDLGAYEYCEGAGPAYLLAVTSASVNEREPADVFVELTNQEPVQAFSFGVAHQGSVATLVAITFNGCPVLDSLNGGAGPDFFETDLDAGDVQCNARGLIGGTVDCVMSQENTATEVIPPGTSQPIVHLTYEAGAESLPGTETSLDVVGCLGDVLPSAIRLMVDFQPVVPEVLGGSLTVTATERRFRRADFNADGEADISDAVAVLGYLFGGTFQPTCLDAGDTDDTGDIDVTDALYLLTYLFMNGPPPPLPFPDCGFDSTADGLDCEHYAQCP